MASITNRVITIYDRKTSMRLAPIEWDAFDYICKREKINRKKLLELIDSNKDESNGLTTAVRLFSIIYYNQAMLNNYNKQQNTTKPSPIFEAIKGIV